MQIAISVPIVLYHRWGMQQIATLCNALRTLCNKLHGTPTPGGGAHGAPLRVVSLVGIGPAILHSVRQGKSGPVVPDGESQGTARH